MATIISGILNELKNSDLTIADVFKAIEYLKYYGYLLKDGNFTVSDFFKAIEQFREFFHINSNENMDKMTLRAMLTTPRCGHPDILAERVEEAKWRKKNLAYCIIKNVSSLDGSRNDELDSQQIALAFSYWAEVADLKFTRTNNQNAADIVFTINRGRAGGFDGPSGTLAYAYLPNGNDGQLSNVRDDDETWITKPNLRGILAVNVLAHEIGHNLGLEHSKNQGALMAPYYSQGVAKPQQKDDIPRIVNLYGKAINPVPPVDPTPTPPTGTTKTTIIFVDGKLYDIPGYSIAPIG